MKVKLNKDTGDWDVWKGKKKLATFPRLQEARAYARAKLLEEGKGSVVVYTPSGREREKLTTAAGVVHAA